MLLRLIDNETTIWEFAQEKFATQNRESKQKLDFSICMSQFFDC